MVAESIAVAKISKVLPTLELGHRCSTKMVETVNFVTETIFVNRIVQKNDQEDSPASLNDFAGANDFAGVNDQEESTPSLLHPRLRYQFLEARSD